MILTVTVTVAVDANAVAANTSLELGSLLRFHPELLPSITVTNANV
ncbi:hypothetical protein OB955_10195 [Halobacteria archaeon AArc-m2/3/4]|uniref:Uncharacterized protein n=1 Tax=Natronoglomus mannanivorans TaxID=2979990 RepID=A0ABT2QDW5_9EURY|nr:hypothetical protein [Halobacteria archaeon AArc-m2/3/4]